MAGTDRAPVPERLLNLLAIVLFVGMLGLVLAQVVMRKFFEPLVWSEELARYVFIWVSFVGWVIASRKRSHVHVATVVQRAPRSLGPGRMRRKPQELRLCFNPNRKDPKGIQEGAVDRVRTKQPDSRSTKRAPRPPEKRDRNVVERDTAGKKMAVIRRIATREGTGRRQQPSAFSQRSLAYAHQRLHDVAHHGL